MSEKKTEGFLKGAMVLMVANILVKIIGAVFRVPLTRVVGDYGMGLYSAAYRYYSLLLTISTAGIPLAISKMISEARTLGRVRESKRIFKIAFLFCAVLGSIGTLYLIFRAEGLAVRANNVEIATSIIALAPAVLLLSIAAGLRGSFQGRNNMLPTGLSQVLEALSRLFVGLFLALLFIKMGLPDKYVAAGAITGVTIGAGLSALLLAILVMTARKRHAKADAELMQTDEMRSGGKILYDLLALAIPVTVGALVINLTNMIDLWQITKRLAVLGYNQFETTTLFGIYDNYAIPLFNLVPSVIISLNLSITPTASAAYARKDMESLHNTLLSSSRIVVMLSLPAAVGIAVLANPIISLLFGAGESANIATPVLAILSVAAVFLCVSSLTSTVLQAIGRPMIPVMTMLAGAVVKVAANYVLIAIPGVELNGAAIGTVLCYVVITLLNLYFLKKETGFRVNFVKTYGKVVLSTLTMGILCLGAYLLLGNLFGNYIAMFASVAIGGCTYFAMLFVTGGITREDVEMLPGGSKLVKILPLRK